MIVMIYIIAEEALIEYWGVKCKAISSYSKMLCKYLLFCLSSCEVFDLFFAVRETDFYQSNSNLSSLMLLSTRWKSADVVDSDSGFACKGLDL